MAVVIGSATASIGLDYSGIVSGRTAIAQELGKIASDFKAFGNAVSGLQNNLAAQTNQIAKGFSTIGTEAKKTADTVKGVESQVSQTSQTVANETANSIIASFTGVATVLTDLVGKLDGAFEKVKRKQSEQSEQTRSFVTLAKNAIDEVGNTLTTLSGSLDSLGIGFIADQGLKEARLTEVLKVRYESFYGSITRAKSAMDGLTAASVKANLPAGDILTSFRDLVPLLQGNQAELEKYVGLVARIQLAKPDINVKSITDQLKMALAKGGTAEDATRIAVSLGVDPQDFAYAYAQTKNFGDALDLVLNKAGYTENAVQKMASTSSGSMVALGEALDELSENAITPFLGGITDMVKGITEFIKTLNNANPAILQIVGGLGLFVTAAIPVVASVGALISVFGQLKAIAEGLGLAKSLQGAAGAAGTLVKTLLPILGAAGIVAGGTALAIAGSGEIAKAGKSAGIQTEERLIGASFEDKAKILWERFTQGAVILVAGFANMVKDFSMGLAKSLTVAVMIVGNAFNVVGAVLEGGGAIISIAFNKAAQTIGVLVGAIANTLPDFVDAKKGLMKFSADLYTSSDTAIKNAAETLAKAATTSQQGAGITASQQAALDLSYKQVDDFWTRTINESLIKPLVNATVPASNTLKEAAVKLDSAAGNLSSDISAPKIKGVEEGVFTEQQIEMWSKFQERLKEINVNEQQQRIETIKQFNDQRQALEERYQSSLLILQRDYLEKQKKAATDLQEGINRIRTSGAERDSKAIQDYNLRRAEAEQEYQLNSQRRLAEFNRTMADMQRNHDMSILEAAANLDARAVFREQQSYAKQQADAERKFVEDNARAAQDFQIQQQREQEQLQRKIEQDRINDQRQIAELQQRYERQREQDRLQYAQKQQEMQVQHAKDQQQIAKQQQERLLQMQVQAIKERMAAEKAFTEQFNSTLSHQNRLLSAHQKGQQQIEAALFAWYNGMKAKMSASQESARQPLAAPAPRNAVTQRTSLYDTRFRRNIPEYETGSMNVPQTQPALVHKGEMIIPASVAEQLRNSNAMAMYQSSFSSASSGFTSQNSATTNIANNPNWLGNMVLNNPTNINPSELQRMMLQTLADVMAG